MRPSHHRTPSRLLLPCLLTAGLVAGLSAPEARAQGTSMDTTEILRRIDANMQTDSAHMTAEMTIHYRAGDDRTLVFESWSEGTEKSFIEFTAPARDRGSRFLRLDEVMWYYLPRIGKSVRIQGHMLRQGMMGSDFSLGDATENDSLLDDYRATLEADTTLNGRRAIVLHLVGTRDDLAYPSVRLWVDSERWIPLREDRYARSGKLLKTMTLSDIRRVSGRWYPFRIEMDNALQTDTRTTLQVMDLTLGVSVPDRYFTLRYLEGGR